jgi:hypothetical protein
MKRTFAAFLCVLMASQAMADGKMYGREKVPPGIPYQRALILYADGIETLILQSKYDISAPEEDSLGWVVPVPAEPEIASIHPLVADSIFSRLSWQTAPRVTRIRTLVSAVIFLAVGACTLLAFVLFALSFGPTVPLSYRKNRSQLARYGCFGLILGIGLAFLSLVFPALFGVRGMETDGVAVLSAGAVGNYDVMTIRSDDSGDLISWLNARDFQYGDEDKAAFDAYVENGWCFVVAMINPNLENEGWGLKREGLPPPLVLRFPYEQPIYPLRLTGTGGFDTEILIYLTCDQKMMCDDRFTLHYAGATSPNFSFRYLAKEESVDPAEFFTSQNLDFPYLCKFKATLTPAQMGQDLVFAPADDNSEFKEHLVEW